MKIDETFSIAINAIKANKTRTFLTMLGIIIGVAAVILLVSIGSGLQQYITKEFEDLGTNLVMVMPGQMRFEDEGGREGGPPGVSSNKLTLKVVDKLERGEYIQDVLPIVTNLIPLVLPLPPKNILISVSKKWRRAGISLRPRGQGAKKWLF
jgi:putative ABC transport system permease protein